METIAKLEYILPQLREYHKDDQRYNKILESASEFLTKKDIHNAAEQLNVWDFDFFKFTFLSLSCIEMR